MLLSRHSWLLAALGLFLAPHAAPAQAPDESACWRLTYAPAGEEGVDERFADYVAVDPGPDSLVRSGMAPGSPSEFWRTLLAPGEWSLRSDTLALRFGNGFSSVRYTLLPRGDGGLRGQARFVYDLVDEGPPPSDVSADPVPCASAHLQTPPVDPAWILARKAARARRARWDAETARVRAIESPLVGTYRFEVKVRGAEPLVLYGRTGERPETPVWRLDAASYFGPFDSVFARPAAGYRIPLVVARTLEALPLAFGHRDEGGLARAAFTLAEQPETDAAGGRVWRGRTDVLFAASRMIGDGPLDAALARASGAVTRAWLDDAGGGTEGAFTLHADGRATVEMRVRGPRGEVLSVRGVRVSAATYAERK